MKNFYSALALVLFLTIGANAKKVKFSVDMTGQLINVTGIHVSGDFQTIAGIPGGDWNSSSTEMLQEGTTNIYSVTLELPAFAKYEYKFHNGDQFYEAEFVPLESRIGYLFNDSRWIYVDSLANDTSTTGEILFAGNAPAGKFLVRFIVDTQTLPSVDASGMHVAGDFQNWDPRANFLYSFTTDVHEQIAFLPQGTYEYKFYNGNTAGKEENIPAACAVNSNRQLTVTKDTVLTAFCFASCTSCLTTVDEGSLTGVKLFPNPAGNFTILSFENNIHRYSVTLTDITGRMIAEYNSGENNFIRIETSAFSKGIYLVKTITDNNRSHTAKLIVE